MSITIKEIAKRANTSIATISRVLNNREKVAQKTIDKIVAIMDETGYRRNQLAGGLAGGKTQVIAMVTPDKENFFHAYYFQQLFMGISRGVIENGYSILINHDEYGNPSGSNHFPVDGYIVISPSMDSPVIEKLSYNEAPSVLINRKSDLHNWVDINNESAIAIIVNHLTRLGHENIAMITGGDNIQNSIERISGYKKALKMNGIAYREDYVINGEFTERKAYEEVDRLVSRRLPITAIMACNDLMAVGAINAVNDNNLRVPEDIAVVGFDDIDGICFFKPSITTFRQPFFEMGRSAAEMLISQIEGRSDTPVNMEFDGKLIQRESCGAYLKMGIYE
ncbi:MAG: LacI family DNA-binding transcriptional regulator [Elusimicrobiota bacterium]